MVIFFVSVVPENPDRFGFGVLLRTGHGGIDEGGKRDGRSRGSHGRQHRNDEGRRGKTRTRAEKSNRFVWEMAVVAIRSTPRTESREG